MHQANSEKVQEQMWLDGTDWNISWQKTTQNLSEIEKKKRITQSLSDGQTL